MPLFVLVVLGLFLIFSAVEVAHMTSSIRYLDMIRAVKKRIGSTIDDATILGIVDKESSFDPSAVREEPELMDASWGLMQVLYSTATDYGYPGDPEGLLDPETNLLYGIRHLEHLYTVFGADDEAVIMAYNEGEGNYKKGKRVWSYYVAVKANIEKWRVLIAKDAAVGP